MHAFHIYHELCLSCAVDFSCVFALHYTVWHSVCASISDVFLFREHETHIISNLVNLSKARRWRTEMEEGRENETHSVRI